MNRKLTLLLIPVLMLTGIVNRGAAQEKTVWDGVYAGPQAVTGQAVYTQYCATCHSPTLNGGASQGAPALKGDKFMENWREDNLESLYTKIKTTMPRRDEKSLNESETVSLVAYILQVNEFPAGPELNLGGMRSIQIQRKDGPQPLPNYALVEVVGCMSQDGTNWALTMAGRPGRIRGSEKSTPEELKAAETRALGTMSFRLQNLAMLGAFKPEVHKDHKMMAKGSLIRQGGTERISVTELEMVGSACK
jgi:mono/diheme cytochrome c family protein